jgi:hypothetical protein
MDSAGDPLLPLASDEAKRLASLLIGTDEEIALKIAQKALETHGLSLSPARVAAILHISPNAAKKRIAKIAKKSRQ